MRQLSLQVAGSDSDAATDILPTLRRNVQNSGDPLLLTALHVCLAEAETRRGLFDVARLHLDSAETLLQRSPSVFLEGNAAIARQCLALLNAEWDEALRQGLRSITCAQASGNVRTLLAAHLNLGQGFLSKGDFDTAEHHLNEAATLCPKGGDSELGLLDALAQVNILHISYTQ